jgi:thiol-disulfide isomerase/thioredoxin
MGRSPLLAAVGLAFSALAATGPYDEHADAKAQIRVALEDASQAKVPVLVVFGANWCGDCKVLDLAFKEGELADARNMGDRSIYEFFAGVSASAPKQP